MKILGLDVSTHTGVCLYEGIGRGLTPRVQCWLWHCYGDSVGEKNAALGFHLGALLKQHPDIRYAAIEAPLEHMRATAKKKADLATDDDRFEGVTNASTIALTNAMVGAAEGVLGASMISCCRVHSGTWRKGFIGVGRAPSHIPPKQRTKWLKNEARFHAEQISKKYGDFHIPHSVDYDAAEAVGITIWLRARVQRFIEEDRLRARIAA